MPTIILETQIKATSELCYKLSLSVDLHQLSTNKTGEHIVDGVKFGVMKLGDFVTWRAKHFGIWQNLSTKITNAEPYTFFKDEMIKAAFKSMKHEHYFKENGDYTMMKDVFVFSSPFGILGKVFNYLILTNYMKKLLIERNFTIKEIAESGRWGEFVN